MRLGLQVGFGDLIGADLLRELREFGFDLIRIEANRSSEPNFPAVNNLGELVQEVLDAGLDPLVIIRDADQIAQIPEGVDVEMGNEPDLGRFGWREGNKGNRQLPSYVDMAMRAIDAASDRNPLWIGCPRGLHKAGFALLKQLPWSRIPSWVGCSFHRYPVNTKGPLASELKQFYGFINDKVGRSLTREEEVAELRRLVGKRPIGISEVGYNRLDYPSEADVAKHMAWERKFWKQQGADFAVAFQINDGPSGSTEMDSHFGFRRHDGSWRPCRDTWCVTAAEQDSIVNRAKPGEH